MMTNGHADAETIARELEAFLRERLNIRRDDPFFTRSVHLFEQGYLDSAGVVETIAHLERRYGIKLEDEVVFDPNFTHVSGMAEVVARTLAGPSGAVANQPDRSVTTRFRSS
jgi:acyl carrier protein